MVKSLNYQLPSREDVWHLLVTCLVTMNLQVPCSYGHLKNLVEEDVQTLKNSLKECIFVNSALKIKCSAILSKIHS